MQDDFNREAYDQAWEELEKFSQALRDAEKRRDRLSILTIVVLLALLLILCSVASAYTP